MLSKQIVKDTEVQTAKAPELQMDKFPKEFIQQQPEVVSSGVQDYEEPEVEIRAEQTSQKPVLQSESFTMEVVQRKRFDRDQAQEAGRLEREMVDAPESWGKERIENLEGTIEVKTVIEEKAVSFWERIEKLTQLQRAIVLSEVLGPPKGLQ